MSTVLDLIGEFGTLNDTKLRVGGTLPPEDEARWTELKRFYELLMSREGLPAAGEMPRFTAEDIRACLSDRERIRVPVEAPIVFEHEGRHYTARVVNLSKSGVFIASEALLPTGSILTLYLASIGSRDQELLEAKGVVAWSSKQGVPEADLPRGMGVRFVDFPREAQEKVDAYVVETIARRLSGLW
ncbi:MAG: PilZ domain-containing protein [Vicinamibacteria bacterium]